MLQATWTLKCQSRADECRTSSIVRRKIACSGVAALIAACVFASEPALADNPVELQLCPATIVNTCFIGYVTSANKVVLLLSSMDSDPMVGGEIEVVTTPSGVTTAAFDLSKQVGSVVMLDATEGDHLYSAKLISVADPLLTALYMSIFLQPATDGAPQ
jgi:hypothetical protein